MSNLRSQRLARKAHESIKARAGGGYLSPSYVARVNRLPLWIRESGLLQTLGFLQDKAEDPKNRDDKNLLADMGSVLDHATNLLGQAQTIDAIAYRMLSREAMCAALWMKRFASGYEKPPSTVAAKPEKAGEEDATQPQ